MLGSFKADLSSWKAQGNYANDDGLNLTLNGNWNWYLINAASNHSSISLSITHKVQAINYLHSMERDCYAVNYNDYIGSLFFYNALALNITTFTKVEAMLSENG